MAVKIVHNKLLGGWYIVTGPHHFPLAGRFPTRQAAKDHQAKQAAIRDARAAAMFGGAK